MTKQRSVAGYAKRATSADEKMRAKVVKEFNGAGTAISTVDSFVNFAAKLGIGADNIMSNSQYAFNPITRNRILLEWMYRGSWVTGVAVDLIADDMTRAGVDMKTDLQPQDQERLDEAIVELDIWSKINEGIKWGRLYGGAIAVLMIDGQDPRTPLNLKSIGPGQFKGLAVFDRWQLEPSLEDLVTEFNQYTGTPRYYRVLPNAPLMQGKAIHYSRLVMRAGGVKLPFQQALIENLWDLSIIERIYDRLVSFDSATTGAAQLVYKSYLRTLKVKSLREIVSAGQNSQALLGLTQYVGMMAKYQSIEGVTMIDGEDEYESEHHGAFAGLSDILLQFGQQLSGALQIPLVRMFGQSPAGLNSTGESDIRTYYDHIKQQQVKTLKVGVTKVYRVLAASLGIYLPDTFRLEFKPLWELSDDERAGIAERIVGAIVQAREASLISQHTAMKELRQSANITGVFTNITDTDIDNADRLIDPPSLSEAAIEYGLGKPEAGLSLPSPSPAGGTQPVDLGQKGGNAVQQPAPAGGTANPLVYQGAQPRRYLQLQPEATNNTPGVRRRSNALGGVSGGVNASGRI